MRNYKTEIKKRNKQNKKKDQHGERFWKDLMGTNRRTYERRGGSIRQK